MKKTFSLLSMIFAFSTAHCQSQWHPLLEPKRKIIDISSKPLLHIKNHDFSNITTSINQKNKKEMFNLCKNIPETYDGLEDMIDESLIHAYIHHLFLKTSITNIDNLFVTLTSNTKYEYNLIDHCNAFHIINKWYLFMYDNNAISKKLKKYVESILFQMSNELIYFVKNTFVAYGGDIPVEEWNFIKNNYITSTLSPHIKNIIETGIATYEPDAEKLTIDLLYE